MLALNPLVLKVRKSPGLRAEGLRRWKDVAVAHLRWKCSDGLVTWGREGNRICVTVTNAPYLAKCTHLEYSE